MNNKIPAIWTERIRAQRKLYRNGREGGGRLREKLLAATADALAVGVDIAKLWRRARLALFRGLEHGKFDRPKSAYYYYASGAGESPKKKKDEERGNCSAFL